MRPKAECAIDSEAMRARGIIVLVKSLKVHRFEEVYLGNNSRFFF